MGCLAGYVSVCSPCKPLCANLTRLGAEPIPTLGESAPRPLEAKLGYPYQQILLIETIQSIRFRKFYSVNVNNESLFDYPVRFRTGVLSKRLRFPILECGQPIDSKRLCMVLACTFSPLSRDSD
jgi:hypothetical protein